MIVPVNGRAQVEAWFAGRGWSPRSFQRETWEAFAKGHCGLVQVSTGAGKTYAAYGAALADWLDQPESHGLHTLYLTPLRAMTRDLEKALCEISADLAPRPCRGSAHRGHVSGRPRTPAKASAACPPHDTGVAHSPSFSRRYPGTLQGGAGDHRRRVARSPRLQTGARRPSWPLPVCARGARVCARGP